MHQSVLILKQLILKYKKIDKGMILTVIERKNKDQINYLDIDIELSAKY